VDVVGYIAECKPLVDRRLEQLLPDAGKEPRVLHVAMRHLVFPGGKRLRPAIALAAAEAVGAAREVALPAAAAVELIHVYSLVHDDLPCMDDDTERRGLPTVHVAHGEAVAVLAGDALQALAFESFFHGAGDLQSAALCCRDLTRAVGSEGLVGGQVDDLRCSSLIDGKDDEARVETILSIHARKSAALIAASAATGGRLGGANETVVEQLWRFGERVGVAFQIADDVLDEDDDAEHCSLVRELGVAECRQRADALLAQALAAVEGLGQPAEPLRELARFAVRREA
jgi:geranylgeranyl diphosphate synthase type II